MNQVTAYQKNIKLLQLTTWDLGIMMENEKFLPAARPSATSAAGQQVVFFVGPVWGTGVEKTGADFLTNSC